MDIETRPAPVARACELAAEIAAAADEIEHTRRIPEALLGRLYDSRLFRMPRSFGGDETEPAVSYAIFADPRSIVAWGPPTDSRARAVDAGYRLTGKWDFASGCRQAHWMGAHCLVLEADGTLINRFGRPTVRTLLFPASEATLLDTWRTIGLCGTASDSYSVNDVLVSEAFSTTREDPTLRRERGALCAFTMQSLYATGVAAVAIGTARAILSACTRALSARRDKGQPKDADISHPVLRALFSKIRIGKSTPSSVDSSEHA